MNNSNIVFYPIAAGFLIAIGLLLGIFIQKPDLINNNKEDIGYGQKIMDIISIIDRNYVDSVNKKELFEKAISDLLHELDPHSNYIAAEDLTELNESIQGKFGGVGIRFSIFEDTLNVVNVIENSPAFRAGIKKYDQITIVDEENIAGKGITNEKVRNLLKGEVGTTVNVTIFRNNETLDKKIIRGDVPLESVSAYYMLTDKIGYIRLGQFSIQSANEFYLATIDLIKQGMEDLVLDLRYNGGGVLSSAVSILETILKRGTPIVSTKGKNSPENIIYSQNNPFLEYIGIAVLINGSSASASEIVAGAIQDNDRGIIIGRRSFGKGLVQQDIKLKDGSNLRLTVSRYYTPTGRSIQKPYTSGYDDYLMDEINRYNNGELYHIDSNLIVDSLKYVTPKGKIVYGGGGIMPDIFVPLDTSGITYYYRKLQYANAFNEFSYYYTRFNKLDKYENVQSFSKNFSISPKILKSFTDFAMNKLSIPFDKKEFEMSIDLIKTSVKAEIARQEWLELGAYYIYNQRDKEIEIAIKELEK